MKCYTSRFNHHSGFSVKHVFGKSHFRRSIPLKNATLSVLVGKTLRNPDPSPEAVKLLNASYRYVQRCVIISALFLNRRSC